MEEAGSLCSFRAIGDVGKGGGGDDENDGENHTGAASEYLHHSSSNPHTTTEPLNRATTYIATDIDMAVVLQALTPRNLVTLFLCLLLEQRIVLVGQALSAATSVGEFLKSALLPFR